LSEIACLPQTEVHRDQQPRNALRVAVCDEVAVLDGLACDCGEGRHPLPEEISLQSVGAANGLKEVQSGSGRFVADVLDGDEIRDVDQGLEARELSREQLVD